VIRKLFDWYYDIRLWREKRLLEKAKLDTINIQAFNFVLEHYTEDTSRVNHSYFEDQAVLENKSSVFKSFMHKHVETLNKES